MDYSNLVDVSEFDTLDTTGASMDPNQLLNFVAVLGKYSMVGLLLSILLIVELWMIFKKCGKPGWAAIIPLYNMWVLLQCADLPGWLSIVPLANIIGYFVACFKLPKKFDKSGAFGLGLLFLPYIFFGLLAFTKTGENKVENTVNSENVPENVPATPESVPTAVEIPAQNVPDVASDVAATPDLMAQNVEPNISAPINEVVPEKQFVSEEPALNTSEPEMPATIPIMEQTPEVQSGPILEETSVNAFDMPVPINNVEINDISNVSTVQSSDNSAEVPTATPVEPLAQNSTDLEPTNIETPVAPLSETPTENLDNNIMTNEAINSDITVTKKCPSCGAENPYVNKVCQNCGNVLE